MLIRSTAAQMNIMFRRKSVFITFYILLALVLANFITNVLTYRGYDVAAMYQSVKLLLLSDESGAYSYYLMQIYPLLVVLPAGFSFALDRDSNETVFFYSRTGGSRYFIGKLFAVFFVTFTVFATPLLLEIGLNALSFPSRATGDLSNTGVYEPTYIESVRRYIWSDFYLSSPYIYAIVYTLLISAVSGIFGVFTVAVSTFRVKYKVLLFLPVYLLLYGLGWLEQLIPSIAVSTGYNAYFLMFSGLPLSGESFALFLLLFTAISVLILVYRGRKDWLK